VKVIIGTAVEEPVASFHGAKAVLALVLQGVVEGLFAFAAVSFVFPSW
jgi:hypothetical protein